MNRQTAIAQRNRAFYRLISEMALVIERLAQDYYTDDDQILIAILNKLDTARFDVANMNHWLNEHPERVIAKGKKEKMSETPRDFGNRKIEKGRFKTPIEIDRKEIAGMKRLG